MMKMKKLASIFLLEENDDADVIIRYSGEKFDPTSDDTALPFILAKRATENIVYSFDGEKKLSNRVDAQI